MPTSSLNLTRNKDKIVHYRPMITRKELEMVLEALIEDHIFSGGIVRRLEKEMAAAYEFHSAFALQSYQSAMEVLKRAFGWESGSRVSAPVFFPREIYDTLSPYGIHIDAVDVTLNSFHPSPEEWMGKINEDTRAVFLSYPYGSYEIYADFISQLKNTHKDIIVIEDITHIVGIEVDGMGPGHGADIALVNMDYGNPITTGKGSVILTDNPKLAKKIRSILPESRKPADNTPLFDGTMVDYTAAMALEQMNMADVSLQRRKKILNIYFESVKDSYFQSVYRYPEVDLASGFPVIFDRDADYVKRYFSSLNIEITSVMPPLHRVMGDNPSDFKNAERMAAKAIVLPAYPSLSKLNVERISASIKGFF